MNNEIYDLIYCDTEEEALRHKERIKKEYPACVFEDASDFIHAHRFGVTVHTNYEQWFLLMLRSGIVYSSFTLNLADMDKNSEERPALVAAAQTYKAELP